jgi:dCMP deaminase
MKALVLYIPVLHAGYLNLFKKYADSVDTLFILGDELISEFTVLHKEIRALSPETAKQAVGGLKLFKKVEILTPESARSLAKQGSEIIVADDSLLNRFIEAYLPQAHVTRDMAFLRWDEKNVLSHKAPENARVSSNALDKEMMELAKKWKEKSPDWWRQVGGVLMKDGKIALAVYNTHVPSEHMPYIDGDPRDSIPAGKLSELSTALHAEAAIIAEAAKRGIALEGASLYTTVFPCPACAKLVAYSGIKKLFFASGHASLDGERVMKVNGVELIWVK